MQDVESSPPGTVMDVASPRNDAGSSNTSIKSPTPSQKAREWEKRINQSMGGNMAFQMHHIILFNQNQNQQLTHKVVEPLATTHRRLTTMKASSFRR